MDYFEKRMRTLSARYARVVYHYPAWFVTVPLIVGAILSSGMFVMEKYDNAMYMYTPYNGKGKIEEETLDHFWPVNEDEYFPSRVFNSKGQCYVYVKSKNHSNLLTADNLQAMMDINNFISEEIQVLDNGALLKYENLCTKWKGVCYSNPLLNLFNTIKQRDSTAMKITYPSMKVGNHDIYLASTIGGVKISNQTGLVESAEAWLLMYQLKYANEEDERRKDLWQKEFERLMLAYDHPVLEISIFHDNSLDEELNRNAHVLAPRLIPCFIVLLAFSAISTIRMVVRKNTVHLDFSNCSPLVAIAGVLSAGLGVSSSVGLLSFLGVKYSRVVAIMPFLIVSVRIDNTFLMISTLASADRRLSVEDRVAEAMSEAAVSIFLTVATDALSFAVGYVTDFPAVQIFCLYTCTAIWVTFMFQLTLLFALLVYEAKRETQCPEEAMSNAKIYAINSLWSKLASYVKPIATEKVSMENGRGLELSHRNKIKADSLPANDGEEKEFFANFFYGPYSTFILNHKVQFCIVCLFLVYLGTSVWGCVYIRQGLEPYKLLPLGSYAVGYYENLEKYMWKYGTQMFITFSNPGNLAEYAQQDKVIDALQNFADSSHGIGMDGMDCWLLQYLKFLSIQLKLDPVQVDEKSFMDYIKLFLSMSSSSAYKQDISWRKNNDTGDYEIVAFRCLLGIKDFNTAVLQTSTVRDMRKIAAAHQDLNISTFNKMWHYVDQYEAILPNIIQECGFGIMCMIILALLLVPKAICSLWVTFAILSVDMGVVGFMTHWGLNMDTVSMITIVMSIGFSVDFSAHIAYAYSVHVHSAPSERIQYALGQLGWPIMQGAISTLLGVLLLADLGSYLINSFFKTVFLVIVSGLLHALIFLPVFMTLSDELLMKRHKRTTHPAPYCLRNGQNEQCTKANSSTADATP